MERSPPATHPVSFCPHEVPPGQICNAVNSRREWGTWNLKKYETSRFMKRFHFITNRVRDYFSIRSWLNELSRRDYNKWRTKRNQVSGEGWAFRLLAGLGLWTLLYGAPHPDEPP